MPENSENQKKNYEEALNAANKLLEVQTKTNEQINRARDGWNDLSNAMFGVSSSQYFEKIPKSNEDLARSAEKIAEMGLQLKNAREDVNSMFSQNEQIQLLKEQLDGVFGGSLTEKSMQFSAQQKADYEELAKQVRDNGSIAEGIDAEKKKNYLLYEEHLELAKSDQEKIQKILEDQKFLVEGVADVHDDYLIKKYAEAVVQDDIAGFIEEQGDKAEMLLRSMGSVNAEMQESLIGYNQFNKSIDDAISKEKELNKEVFKTNEYLSAITENMRKKVIGSVLEFDNAISKAQTNTGIMFKQNSQDMADLTRQSASFGMSVEDTTEMMGQLSNELRSTDFGTISKAAADFTAISAATGASSEDITAIAGEMMRAGASSEMVKQAFQDVSDSSKLVGVNTKAVIGQINKNLSKMREFGFTGGIESLKKMAIQAERLGIEVDEIFNVAERARNIEGAMQMAAELQLAGGSFAQINPMELLSAARKGPEEMGAILTQMGEDIGSFNDNGEFKIDPVDSDRLRMVAESTGMSYDALSKSIEKTAMNQKILSEIGGSGLLGATEEDKAMLTNMLKIGEGGKIEVTSDVEKDFLERAGINPDDLSMLTPNQLADLKKIKMEESKSLEEQAKNNASFEQAMTRLSNAFMQIFSKLQPALTWLANSIAGFAEFIGRMDSTVVTFIAVVGGLTLAVTKFGGLMSTFTGTLGKIGKGAGGLMGGIKDKAKSMFSFSKGEKDTMSKTAGAKGDGGGFKSFASSVKGASKEGKGIDPKGLAKLAAGFLIIGGIVGGAMFLAVQQMSMEDLQKMAMLGLVMIEIAGAMALMSLASKMIDLKGLGILSLGMIALGVSMIPFAYAAKMMTDIDWGSVMIGLGIMLGAVVLLGLIGTAAATVGPMILLGAGLLLAVGGTMLLAAMSLSVMADAMSDIATVDWEGFSQMGPALMTSVPGLLAFSAASLMFLNPVTLLGFVAMTAALSGFASVMTPLADSMYKGSEGFANFAEGISALQMAVENLNMEKLEQLAGMSEELSGISVSSSQSNSSSNGSSSGSSSPSAPTMMKHEITLKLNGRDIQKFIIDDTELQS